MNDRKQNPLSKAKALKRSRAGTRRRPSQRPPRPSRGDRHGQTVVVHMAVEAHVFPAASVFLRASSFSYAIFAVFLCVLPLKRGCIWTPFECHSIHHTIPQFPISFRVVFREEGSKGEDCKDTEPDLQSKDSSVLLAELSFPSLLFFQFSSMFCNFSSEYCSLILNLCKFEVNFSILC